MVWNIFYFSMYWECHHPNWGTHIFQDGWNHQPYIYIYIHILTIIYTPFNIMNHIYIYGLLTTRLPPNPLPGTSGTRQPCRVGRFSRCLDAQLQPRASEWRQVFRFDEATDSWLGKPWHPWISMGNLTYTYAWIYWAREKEKKKSLVMVELYYIIF